MDEKMDNEMDSYWVDKQMGMADMNNEKVVGVDKRVQALDET